MDNIYVYWQNGLLKEVTLEPGQYELLSSPGSLKDDMPDVYEYLENMGRPGEPSFGPDILDLSHYSDFTKKVYETLFYQPFGELISYRGLAAKAGYPNAYRAVGSAMRKNKLMLVVPCHRVVGVNSLGGFTGGMDRKLKLLELEGVDYSHLE